MMPLLGTSKRLRKLFEARGLVEADETGRLRGALFACFSGKVAIFPLNCSCCSRLRAFLLYSAAELGIMGAPRNVRPAY